MNTAVYSQCGKKKRYGTEALANAVCNRASYRRGVKLRTYHCHLCCGFHITKRSSHEPKHDSASEWSIKIPVEITEKVRPLMGYECGHFTVIGSLKDDPSFWVVACKCGDHSKLPKPSSKNKWHTLSCSSCGLTNPTNTPSTYRHCLSKWRESGIGVKDIVKVNHVIDSRVKPFVGLVHGSFVILGAVPEDESRWVMQCKCGNEFVHRAPSKSFAVAVIKCPICGESSPKGLKSLRSVCKQIKGSMSVSHTNQPQSNDG